ncbi:hypothetical protein NCCP2716_14450 [Sporosarcina sp. NCCP-2716]|uniref:hypothetical protein n=1 Tax=Sporosarcina sp. NCCP-2716 TaxID=2943679 RepID=UPI00203FA1DD|nr:hypothetical protein [Sporosarcina sp. NCCP-2716]GKV68947.1 hypothetical protein NCCP2716_14450 [Sporosarcina sp. NCCP-2716]
MEASHQQIDELKQKIEKYRLALESLKTAEVNDSLQIVEKVAKLEVIVQELEQHLKELAGKVQITQLLLDELQQRTEGKGLPEETNQKEGKGENPLLESSEILIPSFSVLKQLASTTPSQLTSSQSLDHSVKPFSNPKHKKNQFKALSLTESLQYGETVLQDESAESKSLAVEKAAQEVTEDSLPDHVEKDESEPPKPEERTTGFWKGILRK